MSNSRRINPIFLFAVCLMAPLLAGCVSGRPAPDTYTSRSGTVTTIETDREACVRSCNNEYSRCGDMLSSAPTSSDVGSQPMPKPFGISADCEAALRACLPRCKGR